MYPASKFVVSCINLDPEKNEIITFKIYEKNVDIQSCGQ